ncbi:hypothetical protein BT69DRAFT_898441 [Atractiella rhizophila]|nr:hypothetical protein BT69DRAFT_898441 [Atractiella rhizophila]
MTGEGYSEEPFATELVEGDEEELVPSTIDSATKEAEDDVVDYPDDEVLPSNAGATDEVVDYEELDDEGDEYQELDGITVGGEKLNGHGDNGTTDSNTDGMQEPEEILNEVLHPSLPTTTLTNHGASPPEVVELHTSTDPSTLPVTVPLTQIPHRITPKRSRDDYEADNEEVDKNDGKRRRTSVDEERQAI